MYEIVTVLWRDSAIEEGPCNMDTIPDVILLNTTGHLIRERDKDITLAKDWYDWQGTHQFRQVTTIPRENIINVKQHIAHRLMDNSKSTKSSKPDKRRT